MFRRLPPAPPLSDDELTALAEQMRDDRRPPAGDNPTIPSAYTYLGQFIDHDITFDPNSSLEQANDVDALRNFRTPRYDLDSVYGSGPEDEPFQYQKDTDPPHLLIEPNVRGEEDLPRTSQGTAIIGDPRNDENTIVGQLQLVFLKLHNRFADEVAADPTVPEDQRMAEAQRRTRWHYQWVVARDFLPRIVGQAVVDERFVLDATTGTVTFDLEHYRPKNDAYMPVEFSVAAYRFGHSQVRGIYDLNDVVVQRPIFLPGDDVGELDDLRGFRPLPSRWTIDWAHFIDLPGASPQPSRAIDAGLTKGLFALPGGGGSLPFRNLKRGQAMALPSGQDVARFLCVDPLSGPDLDAPEPTPLWFYILKEAELQHGGEHLGAVGGRIVAEVLLGLLQHDKNSWVNKDPRWRPTIPVAGDDLKLADLIAFATGLT